ncbi:MAG: YjbH domain-containing protein [Synergistaceae bacterium]|nr:YjbH domain-containing protein [Synergistaceae bacterium]
MIIIFSPLLLLAEVEEAYASHPSSANQGYVGLWEYPTAEMPEDGGGRAGYTGASPYAYYYVDLAWLPWLEINARLTTFDNIFVAASGWVNDNGVGRDYMDKAIDVKMKLHHSRSWYIPSIALGVTDLMGTEIMKSWYGVATWRFDEKFSFSVGYGTDRMNGLFGGVSWHATDWLELKAEYSPLDYTLDSVGSFKPHPASASSKYNVGAVFTLPWGTQGAVSWQRGDEFVFSLSQSFSLNGDFLKSENGASKGKAYEAPGSARIAEWEDMEPQRLGANITEALAQYVRVRDVEVAIGDREILVAYENYGHASQAEAMVRVLVVIAAVSPHLDTLYLIPRVRGVPVVSAQFPGDTLYAIRTRDLETKKPLQSAKFLWADRNFARGREWAWHSSGELRERANQDLKAMLVYEPRIDQTLADDYQSRWSVDLIYEKRSSNGWSAFADVRAPIFSDVNIWWEPDVNEKIRLQQAVISYLANFKGNGDNGIWSLSEVGWLDENWFGVNQWGRVYSRDGRLWGGARLGMVRDRDPLAFAGLPAGQVVYGLGWRYDDDSSPWRTVGWLQAGYNFAGLGLDLQLDYGQFIDTDTGAKLSLVRRWDDAAVGFWISRTDRLSSDKDFTAAGIHLELPAERWFGSWLGNESAHIWEQEVPLLSTWRIDAGREPGSWRNPDRLLSQLRPIELKNNVEDILEEYCAFDTEELEQSKFSSTRGLTDYFRNR